ncbi:MAG TPA: 3-phosphoglycerate dehydrogenase family protein [Candidatus Izemoplasmatales bacterium]|nr:3-phosphoglycerate dehydrogenase family protein [Bacillota bacterium]HRY78225.1 3-phosphoglycerate dehydrogenase family protein [Candidatus Izemoplasmatales bacterium]
MMKIHCLNNISPIGLATLPPQHSVTPNLQEADAILVRSANMLEMTLPVSVLAIARAGAGVNNIPLDKCADAGIVVFNTPGANANGVKELVIAGMLLACRDIHNGIRWVEENKGDPDIAKTVEKAKAAFGGTEILGKTLGVIGLGAIGVLVANAAVGLGMRVLGADPFLTEENRKRLDSAVVLTDNATIYAQSDFITLHVPALPETKGMINAAVFAQMKPTAVLLNFARDILVHDDDLKTALAEGKLRLYVTDFPNPKTANMAKVIAIPHLGASTEESEDNCAVMAVRQLVDFVDNGNIVNSVNFPALNQGIPVCEGRILVLFKNAPDLADGVQKVFADLKADHSIRLESMVQKTKGAYGAMLLDLSVPARFSIQQRLLGLPGVTAVRMIK